MQGHGADMDRAQEVELTMLMTAAERLWCCCRRHQSATELLPDQTWRSRRLRGTSRISAVSTCFSTSRGHSLRDASRPMPAACTGESHA